MGIIRMGARQTTLNIPIDKINPESVINNNFYFLIMGPY